MISMRDAFLDRLYELAKVDRDIILISTDVGAPSLDKFRRDLSSQYINIGIAEQNAITVATGLSMGGKKVFVFGISPFVSMRCYEAMKVNLGLMNIPVTVFGVGAGFSYEGSGMTHNSLEDISIMRVMPNMVVLCPSDSVMASKMVDYCCGINSPSYVRLDREALPTISDRILTMFDGIDSRCVCGDYIIVSTGNMVHKSLEVVERLGDNVSVLDIFRLKPFNSELFLKLIEKTKKIVTIEEHWLEGGLGSIIAETLVDNGLSIPLLRIGVPNGIYRVYGRENIHRFYGLDVESLTKKALNFFNGG